MLCWRHHAHPVQPACCDKRRFFYEVIADAVVETHDRIVGKTWRDAKKICDARVADAKSALHDTLHSFKTLGVALLEAKGDEASLDTATENACGWHQLEGLVATAAKLTDTMAADPLSHVVQGFHRFRRYAPRMLRAFEIQAAPVAEPLLAAATIVEKGRNAELAPAHFLRRGSKWHRHINACDEDRYRLWEVAVLFHLRDAFRSGDIWLAHSRRYADLKQALVPIEVAKATPRLTVSFEPEVWIADRKTRLAETIRALSNAPSLLDKKARNSLILSYFLRGSGGPRRIRTPDPLIRSQVLYPAELSVHVVRFSLEATALQEPIGAIVHASSNATALR